jgi:hypothetical protein
MVLNRRSLYKLLAVKPDTYFEQEPQEPSNRNGRFTRTSEGQHLVQQQLDLTSAEAIAAPNSPPYGGYPSDLLGPYIFHAY